MKMSGRIARCLGVLVCLTAFGSVVGAQNRLYKEMNRTEQTAFVSEQSRNLTRQLSGVEYGLTAEFVLEIQKSVDYYSSRIDNNGGDRLGKGDARFVFDRGQAVAPSLIRVFKARNLSPLFGLYIPLVESEYVNIQTPNQMGSTGMFQFIPQTGQRFGLSPADLLDVEKSADAAASYISALLLKFSTSSTKEALALLSYNRGEGAVERDVAAIIKEDNKGCSICALTAARYQLDKSFQSESVNYVPRFLAGAIIGENPQVFGLKTKPLSSLDASQ
jgi:hypothetical protein